MAIAVYVLTALAAVAIVVTWLRLRTGSAPGRQRVGRGVLRLHTIGGALAVVLWTIFLVAPGSTFLGGSAFGIVGLALWWVVSLAGLLLIVRWLPARGKHASSDHHGSGVAVALLVHLGVLAAVAVFTWAYLTSAV